MQLRNRKVFSRTVGGAAIVAASALAVPALASAEPVELTGPTVTTNVEANTLNVTLKNTNSEPTSTCGAFALESSKLAELEADPGKIDDPGFLSWRTDIAQRVGPGDEDTFSAELTDGLYAVVGECVSPNSEEPAVSRPQIVSVPDGGLLGSVDLGSLEDGMLDGIAEFVQGLLSGSAMPAA
ncbi:hypothetical protein AB4Z09_19620 [Rhodococcus sp. TAF43]|uniref:hypothetical protein n=1 Tax=unclassified Rhodococcus (in: high G+C Gram-positive bacteria) TaxID=192944 RepID=UPI000E0AC947|nr:MULTISPECIES: hypothetical protein [unclassified Rhodococcus (in: high G+C Gram-positive bacteria)]QKT09795.1 hypothetical protein HUN07_02810 [Rhodococcus sp. W8901]RDI28124.1 hypothetical protein DEU38_10796 [Rhodococcus sp. AG1013]